MANWRRKVLALFPDLRREAERPSFTIYSSFFELLPRVRQAHQDGDKETLQRIYGFAEWCFQQKAKDMWNAAGVAFYEHLFDSHPTLWPEIVKWLSPNIINNCLGLWKWRLPEKELVVVHQLIAERKHTHYLAAKMATLTPPSPSASAQ